MFWISMKYGLFIIILANAGVLLLHSFRRAVVLLMFWIYGRSGSGFTPASCCRWTGWWRRRLRGRSFSTCWTRCRSIRWTWPGRLKRTKRNSWNHRYNTNRLLMRYYYFWYYIGGAVHKLTGWVGSILQQNSDWFGINIMLGGLTLETTDITCIDS